ncbi:GtrA family protein [Amycolatopsis sp. NPDC054798]
MPRPRELFRFAVVGAAAYGVTMVVDYSLKLTVLHEKPVTALAIATVASTAFAYLMSRRWSFVDRGGHGRWREAALFFAVNAGAVAANLVPLLASRYVLRIEEPHVGYLTQEIADFVAGMVLGTLAGTAFRWFGYRRWVFPRSVQRTGIRCTGEAGLAAERLPGSRSEQVAEVP